MLEQLQALDKVRCEILALRESVHGELERHAEAVRDLGSGLELQLERSDNALAPGQERADGAGSAAADAGAHAFGEEAPEQTRQRLHRQEAARQAMLRRAWSQPSFRPRASLLTTMLEGRRDYQTIYSMAVAGMAWLGINMVVQAAF